MVARLALALAFLATSTWTLAGCGGDSFHQPAPEQPAAEGGADAPGPEAGPDATVPDAAQDQHYDVQEPDGGPDSAPDGDKDGEPDGEPAEAGPLADGELCSAGNECSSGVCADGVCCDRACDGCEACAQAGSVGVCSALPAGVDPKAACGAAGDTCSGVCDGAGACDYPDVTTPCGTPSCDGAGTSTVVPLCDGAGQCSDTSSLCKPYVCDGATGACFTSCSVGGPECTPTAFCDSQAQCVGKLVDGTPCTAGTQCESTLCVDGVCCAAACDGLCEACDVAGSMGTCAPVPNGQDPALECVGAAAPCSGACNGSRACAFPGATMQCAPSTCASGTATQHDWRCDGTGVCQDQAEACEPYLCDPSLASCRTACAGDGDCVSGHFCEQPQCRLKKPDGQLCGGANQCQSGYCEPSQVGATCCAQSCPSPNDCSTGACVCGGVVCSSGHACQLWYPDVDQDTFGDPAGAKAACDDLAPKDLNGRPYVANDDDCYDGSANARPGQTSYFFEARGDGSFDYDCSGTEDKQYRDGLPTMAMCFDCKTPDCQVCGTNSTWYTLGFSCDPTPAPCGPLFSQGFKGAQPCGTKGNLFFCQNAVFQCSLTVGTTAGVEQRCR